MLPCVVAGVAGMVIGAGGVIAVLALLYLGWARRLVGGGVRRRSK